MKRLSAADIAFITQKISRTPFEDTMKNDLAEHLFYFTEEELKKGKSFHEAYGVSRKEIAPQGFEKLGVETVYLLTDRKRLRMKRAMYIMGFAAALGLTTSILFKFGHWPGANVIMGATVLLMVFGFFPMLFLNLYKQQIRRIASDKVKYFTGYLGLSFLVSGLAFKALHWPGAYLLIFFGVLLLNFGFFPLLFFKMYRSARVQASL